LTWIAVDTIKPASRCSDAGAAFSGPASPSGSDKYSTDSRRSKTRPTIYLLPECDSEEKTVERLREVIRDMFEEQLDAWYRVPSVWPTERDLTTFGDGLNAVFIR